MYLCLTKWWVDEFYNNLMNLLLLISFLFGICFDVGLLKKYGEGYMSFHKKIGINSQRLLSCMCHMSYGIGSHKQGPQKIIGR
jgi:hypothetical protein